MDATEADAVFEADADLYEQRDMTRDSNTQHGKHAMMTAKGGLASGADTNEQTPLLGRTEGASEALPAALEWPGQADFAGLPWWKTPSVRSDRSFDCKQNTDEPHRSTSCSLHSFSSPWLSVVVLFQRST